MTGHIQGVMYSFLAIGELDRTRLAAALADLTAVPAGDVDVRDEDDQDSRNRNADVICTCARMSGDADWMLDIYLTGAVPGQPGEPVMAVALAQALDALILYEAPITLPSAFWLAAPGGQVTRARVYSDSAENGDTVSCRLDAVEQPVPRLPSVPVARQPEVIREYPVPAPITAGLSTWLAVSPLSDAAGHIWQVHSQLGAWENLGARMAAGWPPDGWYPAGFYREDLLARDDLATLAALLPGEVSGPFSAALERIDASFECLTENDTEFTLAAAVGITKADIRLRGWWWHRIPNPLPWPAPEKYR